MLGTLDEKQLVFPSGLNKTLQNMFSESFQILEVLNKFKHTSKTSKIKHIFEEVTTICP